MARPSFAELLTRRDLLKGAGAFAAYSFLPQCLVQNNGRTTAPTNPQPPPAGTITTASMTVVGTPYETTVGSASALASIGPEFIGFSYEKSSLNRALFTANNTQLINLFKLLGTGIFRIGAKTTEDNTWVATGTGQTLGQIAPSDIDNLAAFIKATGWKVIYGTPWNGSAGHPTAADLANTAAEAVYAINALGASLYALEIANEPDLDSYWPTESSFGPVWEQYRTAILAAAAGAVIPSFIGPSSASGTWPAAFSTDKQSEIILLTDHHYIGSSDGSNATIANLLVPDGFNLGNLSNLFTDTKGTGGSGLPFRVSETNTFTETSNSVSEGGTDPDAECYSYASALWAIDFLFSNAQYGCSGVNFHGGCDYRKSDSDYAYTPLYDSGYTSEAGLIVGGTMGLRPLFYGIYFFSLVNQGTLLNLTVSSGSLNVTSYAVLTSSGLSLVISNKDSAQNLQVAVTLPHAYNSATLLEMTQLTPGALGPSLTAASGVTIQGATINPDSTFSPATVTPYDLAINGKSITCYVPYLSAVLVQLS